MAEYDQGLFGLFILSLADAALIGMGYVPDPETSSYKKNLEQARYNIDLLEMMKIKTQGNLTAEEARLLDDLLYDLHIKFVETLKANNH